MKKIISNSILILLFSVILNSCGSSSATINESSNDNVTVSISDQDKGNIENIDICRCLTEPGNSAWAVKNNNACRDAISKELGVENWEKVNFSKNPALSKKWDALVKKCTGTSKVETGIESVDINNQLVPQIGTASGYVWESINNEAQLYTTLAFDGLIFRTTAYMMNGQTNSENFTKVIDVSGKWTAIDAKKAKGIIDANNVSVSWIFSEDYSKLTNNKGVIFKRVKVQ